MSILPYIKRAVNPLTTYGVQPPQLALIHIPIQYYSLFLQPILRLLFGDDHDEDAVQIPWTNRHEFLNVSITPTEISIMCDRDLAERYITPIDSILRQVASEGKHWHAAQIVPENYIVIQVDGQGLDAGQRVLELTGPLAMAGISIFFISTYFSDYILVPSKAKRTVSTALEQRGFVFSRAADAFVSQLSPSLVHDHQRYDSSSSNGSFWSPSSSRPPSASAPTTPPAKDIDELQLRTFRKLKKSGIKPQADASLRLVSCAGSREPDDELDAQLKNELLQVLLAKSSGVGVGTALDGLHISDGTNSADLSNPIRETARFLSITIASSEPVSILLEERLVSRFGASILGAKEAADVLIPITFNLESLGFETTGIVGGVAGRLANPRVNQQLGYEGDVRISPKSVYASEGAETAGDLARATHIETSFLSTANSGTVIVPADQLSQAMKELEDGYEEVTDGHEYSR